MIIPIETMTQIYFEAYREKLNENETTTASAFYAMKKVNDFVEEFNKLEKLINGRE